MSILIPLQQEFRQGLPEVRGNVDYLMFRKTLERMEEVMRQTGLDRQVMEYAVRKTQEKAREKAQEEGKRWKGFRKREQEYIQKRALQGFRCTVARHFTGDTYRVFSRRLADSPLLQRFCRIDRLEVVRVPSKSALQRAERMMPESMIRGLVQQMTKMASREYDPVRKKQQVLGLEKAVSLGEYYVDTTCVQSTIHYPVDWVLMRDVCRTMMKAVQIIRREGLKHRMKEPAYFMKQMNRLSIEMTHSRRRKESRKERKRVLRKMKKALRKIAGHAERHRNLLQNRWKETTLHEGEVKQIIDRINRILAQVPAVVWQAHERIIGGRRVASNEKILSVYESDIHVIVRGKAGAEIEFGNTLMLGEQEDGIIVDWKLYRKAVPAEHRLLPESLNRVKEAYGNHRIAHATTDRGFYSRANQIYLEEANIEDCMCPRSPDELLCQLQDEGFRKRQIRRGQTEGRIGILKNTFLGRRLRSKGFVAHEIDVTWAILAHNLWVIARLPCVEEKNKKKPRKRAA